MVRPASLAAVLLAALSVCDSAGSAARTGGLQFVPASSALQAKCRLTARSVGYAVPCPMRVPKSLAAYGGRPGCAIDIIGPAGLGGCAKSWRGWVVGSGIARGQHLVITASPGPLSNDAKVVNGPAWYPAARVRLLTRVAINAWRMHAVLVPPATNDGSAFAGHVVLIWTVGEHTYAVGFHDVDGLDETLHLDEELARSIRLVGP